MILEKNFVEKLQLFERLMYNYLKTALKRKIQSN